MRSWIRSILIPLLLVSQLIYAYIFFIEPNWIEVKHVAITSERLARALGPTTIVQISDLHIAGIGFREVSLIEKINKINPDIIVITGDNVGSRESITSLWNLLALLEPRMRTYVVSGDQDLDIQDLLGSEEWDKAKTSIIDGVAARIKPPGAPGAFILAGVPLETAFRRLNPPRDPSEPVIVLSHRPDAVKQLALQGIDLVLSGHTHGGQTGVALLRKLFPYADRSMYMAGLFKVKETLLYVNKGIFSEKGVRFLARPEATLFTFVAKDGDRPTTLPQDAV